MKKVMFERELRGDEAGSHISRAFEAIDAEHLKKGLAERELRGGNQKEAAGDYTSRGLEEGPGQKRAVGGAGKPERSSRTLWK